MKYNSLFPFNISLAAFEANAVEKHKTSHKKKSM